MLYKNIKLLMIVTAYRTYMFCYNEHFIKLIFILILIIKFYSLQITCSNADNNFVFKYQELHKTNFYSLCKLLISSIDKYFEYISENIECVIIKAAYTCIGMCYRYTVQQFNRMFKTVYVFLYQIGQKYI